MTDKVKENELVLKAIENTKKEAKEKVERGNLGIKEMEKIVEEMVRKIDIIEQKGSHNMLYQQIVLLAELSEKTDDVDELIKLTHAMVNAHTAL